MRIFLNFSNFLFIFALYLHFCVVALNFLRRRGDVGGSTRVKIFTLEFNFMA